MESKTPTDELLAKGFRRRLPPARARAVRNWSMPLREIEREATAAAELETATACGVTPSRVTVAVNRVAL